MSPLNSKNPGKMHSVADITDPCVKNRKLFVGGLPPHCREHHLCAFANKFGELDEVEVRCEGDSQKCRGFGFLTFMDAASAARCRGAPPSCHMLLNQLVSIKPMKDASDRRGWKLFVGGLDGSVTSEELTDALSGFGAVEECYIVMRKDTVRVVPRQSRCFGFVTFYEQGPFETLLFARHVDVQGKSCEIRCAGVPKDVYYPTDGLVHIGGLPADGAVTEAGLRAYFETKYNTKLSRVVAVTDSSAQHSGSFPTKYRGFGFIAFEDPVVAYQVIGKQHFINGYKIECSCSAKNSPFSKTQHKTNNNSDTVTGLDMGISSNSSAAARTAAASTGGSTNSFLFDYQPGRSNPSFLSNCSSPHNSTVSPSSSATSTPRNHGQTFEQRYWPASDNYWAPAGDKYWGSSAGFPDNYSGGSASTGVSTAASSPRAAQHSRKSTAAAVLPPHLNFFNMFSSPNAGGNPLVSSGTPLNYLRSPTSTRDPAGLVGSLGSPHERFLAQGCGSPPGFGSASPASRPKPDVDAKDAATVTANPTDKMGLPSSAVTANPASVGTSLGSGSGAEDDTWPPLLPETEHEEEDRTWQRLLNAAAFLGSSHQTGADLSNTADTQPTSADTYPYDPLGYSSLPQGHLPPSAPPRATAETSRSPTEQQLVQSLLESYKLNLELHAALMAQQTGQ